MITYSPDCDCADLDDVPIRLVTSELAAQKALDKADEDLRNEVTRYHSIHTRHGHVLHTSQRRRHLRAWDQTVPLEQHPVVYAECQGPADPVCGRARYSVHGCGGRQRRDGSAVTTK